MTDLSGVGPEMSTATARAAGDVAALKGAPTASGLSRPSNGNGSPRAKASGVASAKSAKAPLPIRLLHDRILVRQDGEEGERRSTGGIVIPATAQVGKRLVWARVVGVGPNVRSVDVESRVLFEPDDRFEVEIHGDVYLMLRERDIHAVATEGSVEGSTGLYL